jgi:hypothetical protein
MKCVKNGDKVSRVSEEIASKRVDKGWKYCPKSEFKKSTQKELIEKPAAVKREGPKTKRQRPMRDDTVHSKK